MGHLVVEITRINPVLLPYIQLEAFNLCSTAAFCMLALILRISVIKHKSQVSNINNSIWDVRDETETQSKLRPLKSIKP